MSDHEWLIAKQTSTLCDLWHRDGHGPDTGTRILAACACARVIWNRLGDRFRWYVKNAENGIHGRRRGIPDGHDREINPSPLIDALQGAWSSLSMTDWPFGPGTRITNEDRHNCADAIRDVVDPPWRRRGHYLVIDRPAAVKKIKKAIWGADVQALPDDWRGTLYYPTPAQTDWWDSYKQQEISKLAHALAAGDQTVAGPLSDLLEESGCDDEELIGHFRGLKRCPGCGRWGRTVRTGQGCMGGCNGTGFVSGGQHHHLGCWGVQILLGGVL